MRIRALQVVTASVVACMGAWIGIACVACQDVTPAARPDDLVKLRWTRAYDAETRADVQIGLWWGLSFLGADLPADASDVLVWQGDTVTLNIERAGVAAETLPAWRALFAVIRQSDEYRVMGAMDIGRFFMLTLGSSKHYFALTGARSNYQEARSRYRFGGTTGAIVESGVARGQRLIEMSEVTQARDVAFVAHEGSGSIPAGTFDSHEFEVLDFMNNGQLRVALYDRNGHLKDSANPELTAAGKPAKCLWCHEIRLLPAMNNHTDAPGHYTTAQFDAEIARRMQLIEARREGLRSQIDFTHLQDHRYLEYLYLSFAEPTLERLAREWRVAPEDAARRMAGKRVIHGGGEFKFLGEERYSREDVDTLGPYAAIRMPASLREPSAYEPDLLTGSHQNTAPASP
jgi:hypothetical protein